MEEPHGYSIHPLLLQLTEGTPEEKAALVQDIHAQGLLVPVTRLGKWVVDGRRRLDACELAGVEPRFEDLPADADPVQQIIARNFLRRHMTPSQRATFAALLSGLSTPGRPPVQEDNSANLPSLNQAEAATLVGVSPRTVGHASRVMSPDSPATPELQRAVIDGQVSVSAASRVVNEAPEVQRRVVDLVSTGKARTLGAAVRKVRLEVALPGEPEQPEPTVTRAPSETTTLHAVTIAGLYGLVEPGSLDAVIVHPPQDAAGLELLPQLSAFAARALKASGVMVVVGTGTRVLEMLSRLDHPDLVSVGEWDVIFNGPPTRVERPYPMSLRRRPLFVFGKLDFRPEGDDLIEVPDPESIGPGTDRAELAMQLIMDRFVKSGQRVCDPIMLDRAFTALAAWKVKATFTGAHPVESQVAAIRDRLAAAAGSPGWDGSGATPESA